MEDEEKTPLTRVQRLSRAAFDALKDKGVSERALDLYEQQLHNHDINDIKTQKLIKNAVFATYAEFMNLQLSLDDIHAAGKAAIDQLRVIQSQPSDSKATQELRKLVPEAFKQDYKGDADVRFQRYLTGCCYTYLTVDRKMYNAPYVAITQSSGFGKSRILKRLADKEGPIKHGNTSFDMKVLYVCARKIKRSSGYPRATPKLCDWLFPVGTCTKEYLATALEKAFRYSVETWDVRESWKKLFEVDVNETADGAMAGELNSVQLDKPYRKRQKLEARTTQVLVVAIDEARTLLTIENAARENALHILRRALREVNTTDTVRNANGLVFAVLVDTNSRVHELVPALSQDPSSRLSDPKNMALFPPFILTETMDIMLGVNSTSDSEEDPKMSAGDTIMDSESGSDEVTKMSDVDIVDRNTSRSRVLTTDEKDVWTALVSMGRPLWRSMDDTKKSLPERKDILTRFAARKLLIGLEMNKPASYTDSTLHGVSSLFCRIGLRPYASSPIATRLVADFMSVLHYVTYKNDAQISGYVSDPILTFGASRIWHQFENPTTNLPSVLESDILPQLETILINGLIDPGNIGELVARVFLLLAMDAVAMGSSDKRVFGFSGGFCDVMKFVEMLVGDDPYRQEQDVMISYKDWLEYWNGWKVCFSHFVDLQEEPTEDVLWKMLDRRAAGTFPRGQKGADLIIPILRPKCDSYPEGKVSFIVVQVKNRAYKDDKFPDSALRKLSCPYVFTKANSLSKFKNHEVIRLYVSLREVLDENHFAQSIVTNEIKETTSVTKQLKKLNRKKDFDGSLCVRGVLAPDMNERWSFLTTGLAERLRVIANAAWWDGELQVKYDLKSRDAYEKVEKQNPLSRVLSADDAVKRALHTLKFASKMKAE